MEHNDLAWYAVVNPHAGTGKLLPKWKMAEDLMRCKGIDCRYMSTDCRFHATELTCSAAEEGFRRFIAVGGDGTAHEILDGIMHYISDVRLKGGSVSLSDFTLAVVPIGSGNDWIKSHHIPYDVGEVVDMISAGSFSGQDIVKVTSSVCDGSAGPGGISYMINIGGAGLDAMICERVNRQKDRGKSGRLLYVNSLIYNLVRIVFQSAVMPQKRGHHQIYVRFYRKFIAYILIAVLLVCLIHIFFDCAVNGMVRFK